MSTAFRAPEPVGAADRNLRADEILLHRAEGLAAASAVNALPRVLLSRNLAILCRDADGAEAGLFASAACELGAHVAFIPVTLSDQSSLAVIRETARMLARLYDGVECLDTPPLLVELMQESAPIPFFLGLSTDTQRTAALVERLSHMPGAQSTARRRVLQASLAQALGL
jgi:ornithine carbamoyltransferase